MKGCSGISGTGLCRSLKEQVDLGSEGSSMKVHCSYISFSTISPWNPTEAPSDEKSSFSSETGSSEKFSSDSLLPCSEAELELEETMWHVTIGSGWGSVAEPMTMRSESAMVLEGRVCLVIWMLLPWECWQDVPLCLALGNTCLGLGIGFLLTGTLPPSTSITRVSMLLRILRRCPVGILSISRSFSSVRLRSSLKLR